MSNKNNITITVSKEMDKSHQSLPNQKTEDEINPEFKPRTFHPERQKSSIWKRLSFDSKSNDFDNATQLLQLENKSLFEKCIFILLI